MSTFDFLLEQSGHQFVDQSLKNVIGTEVMWEKGRLEEKQIRKQVLAGV